VAMIRFGGAQSEAPGAAKGGGVAFFVVAGIMILGHLVFLPVSGFSAEQVAPEQKTQRSRANDRGHEKNIYWGCFAASGVARDFGPAETVRTVLHSIKPRRIDGRVVERVQRRGLSRRKFQPC